MEFTVLDIWISPPLKLTRSVKNYELNSSFCISFCVLRFFSNPSHDP